MKCTIPKIFGLKEWFDKHFADLCELHDESYTSFNPLDKLKGDFIIMAEIWKRGYWWLVLIFVWYYLLIFGTFYWLWRKLINVIKSKV